MRHFFIPALLLLGISGCIKAPDVIDRHTLMEEEAAGEWPNFERELLDKAKAPGPTAFRKVEPGSKEKRLYNVLNGEPVAK